MYKDGRFANLQRRRKSTEDGERLRRHVKRRKRNWSAGANAIGRARRVHAVELSCVLVPNVPCTRTRTQFHVIDSSQPGLARHVRVYVRTQKKQYTSSSVGLAQARPNYY